MPITGKTCQKSIPSLCDPPPLTSPHCDRTASPGTKLKRSTEGGASPTFRKWYFTGQKRQYSVIFQGNLLDPSVATESQYS